MTDNKDTIYREADSDNQVNVAPFKFDKKVANVFSDMISRSVPSYRPILQMLPTLTREFRQHEANYYDLGCSLGAGLHAMAEGLKPLPHKEDIRASLVGIDNSQAMIAKAMESRCPYSNLNVEYKQQDILETEISNAAMVLMNFTLQFIDIEYRDSLIEKIYRDLNNGGALVLSEKVSYADQRTQTLMTDIHHGYKLEQGYSQLEISRKRDAIENVLVPETLEAHIERLSSAGFQVINPWFQNLQFLSILAVK